jgi:hypothetical protein
MRWLALFALLSFGSTASAQEMTGNELLSLCQSNPSLVTGYVTGISEGGSRATLVVISKYSVGPGDAIKSQEDANAWVSRLKSTTKELQGYCFPSGVTRAQSRGVICKYLQDNPAERHLSGAFLTRVALTKAWPCTDD